MMFVFWSRRNKMEDVVAICAIPQSVGGEDSDKASMLASRLNIYVSTAEKLIAKALRDGLIKEGPRVHPSLENYVPTEKGAKLLPYNGTTRADGVPVSNKPDTGWGPPG